MGSLRTERSTVSAMRRVQLKDRERDKDFMMMLGLNKNIDQLALVNSVHWYLYVSIREDSYFMRMA